MDDLINAASSMRNYLISRVSRARVKVLPIGFLVLFVAVTNCKGAIHFRKALRKVPYTANQICQRHPSFDLNNTASPANWTIVMGVNDGFYDFIMNWYIYFEKLQMNANLVFVCEDDQVYEKLSKQTLHDKRVSMIRTNEHNLHSEALNYGSPEYNKFVTTRPSRLISVSCSLLGQTDNLIYADADAVWKKNPIPYLEQVMYNNNNADIAMQQDHLVDMERLLCTGFMGMKLSTSLIRFLDYWERKTKHFTDDSGAPIVQDQDVFNMVISEAGGLHNHLGLKLEGLSQQLFPNGHQYFQLFNATEKEEVVVVHNNFVVGHSVKLGRFKQFGLWKYNSSYGTGS